MYKSNIKRLINKLSTIEQLEQPIVDTYDIILEGIENAEDYSIDFRHTLKLEKEDVYINIEEIDKKTKMIKQYALGIKDRIKRINKLRHDNKNHHNEKKIVKGMNPPHHKHIGKDETLKGFSGNIDDLVDDFKNIFSFKIT